MKAAPAFKAGTVREWLLYRNENMLSSAVVKIGDNVWIDIDRFNVWLSLDKDTVSDFRNLRTTEQVLKSSYLKPSKLDSWLRQRHSNGLDEAVIKKGGKRLYIDIHKFNRWLWERNQNPDFGAVIPPVS